MAGGILTAYIEKVMAQAVCERLEDGSISGHIPLQVFREVGAVAETEEACQEALRGLLEEWVVIWLREGSLLPVLDGLDLNKVERPKLSREELAARYKNPVQWTEHPWVVRVEGYNSGRPIILGSAIAVRSIAIYHVRHGMTIWDILEGFPHLRESQVYDALAYYYDHQEEVDADIEADSEERLIKLYIPGMNRLEYLSQW